MSRVVRITIVTMLFLCSSLYVLSTSAAYATGRFYNPTWDSVQDRHSTLLWQARSTEQRFTHQGAVDYCAGIILANTNGWRLPHVKELASIVDVTSYNPSIYPYFKTQNGSYWSSTALALPDDKRFYWTLNFSDGHMHAFRSDTGYFVRCVSDAGERSSIEEQTQ